MNYEEPPPDCRHPGFFHIWTTPVLFICWQCGDAVVLDL